MSEPNDEETKRLHGQSIAQNTRGAPPLNGARACGLCLGLGCRMCNGTGRYEPPMGLVERLRNGGQADLADMAEGLLTALKELDECYCEASERMSQAQRARHRAALINARTAIAKATQ